MNPDDELKAFWWGLRAALATVLVLCVVFGLMLELR